MPPAGRREPPRSNTRLIREPIIVRTGCSRRSLGRWASFSTFRLHPLERFRPGRRYPLYLTYRTSPVLVLSTDKLDYLTNLVDRVDLFREIEKHL